MGIEQPNKEKIKSEPNEPTKEAKRALDQAKRLLTEAGFGEEFEDALDWAEQGKNDFSEIITKFVQRINEELSYYNKEKKSKFFGSKVAEGGGEISKEETVKGLLRQTNQFLISLHNQASQKKEFVFDLGMLRDAQKELSEKINPKSEKSNAEDDGGREDKWVALIRKGEAEKVIKSLGKYDYLGPKSAAALIEQGLEAQVAGNLSKKFDGLDQGIAISLAKAGYGQDVLDNLSVFKIKSILDVKEAMKEAA